MNDATPPDLQASDDALSLDVFLRATLPEIKLALGELIDRENARSLPGRYARLLPETLLAVTLRPDAAAAIAPIAGALEEELTDSCMRHGSLYDRAYRVQLRRVDDERAPLYSVSAHAGQSPPQAAAAQAEPETATTVAADATVAEPAPLPALDPDATQLDGYAPPRWEPGRWLLVVADEEGDEHEVFRLSEPLTTVGRHSDDPGLQTTVALGGARSVSRRQLALVWDERDGQPGFLVYNLGLPAVHAAGRDVPGAHVGRGPLRLETVGAEHTLWLAPGTALRIGDRGPTLRIEEVPAEVEDPEATQFE